MRENHSPAISGLDLVLRSRGDRLRLDAQVLTSDGSQIWAGKYHGNLADSFDWQDEVGGEIAAETLSVLLDREGTRLAGKSIAAMSAEECCLSGAMSGELADWGTMAKSLEYYAAAIEKDPSLTEAVSDGIVYYISASSIGYDDLVQSYGERFGEWMAAASAHVKVSPVIELALGLGMFRRSGDVTAQRRTIRAVLRRAPFTIEIVLFSGWGYAWMGKPQPALDCFRQNERVIRCPAGEREDQS